MEDLAEQLLKKVSNLTSISGRRESAQELAKYLGVEDLIIFIVDHALNVMLP